MLELRDGAVDGPLDILSICSGQRRLCVEFFNLKCTRCPSALAKLQQGACAWPSWNQVVVCCLSTGGDDDDEARLAAQMVQDLSIRATFAFMRRADKEVLKAQLGFAMLPFFAAFDLSHEGRLLGSGDPTMIDVGQWIAWDDGVSAHERSDDAEPSAPADLRRIDEDRLS